MVMNRKKNIYGPKNLFCVRLIVIVSVYAFWSFNTFLSVCKFDIILSPNDYQFKYFENTDIINPCQKKSNSSDGEHFSHQNIASYICDIIIPYFWVNIIYKVHKQSK
jgi:hypothetical protein